MKIPEIAHDLSLDPALVLRIVRQLGIQADSLDSNIPPMVKLRTMDAIVLINSFQLSETNKLWNVIEEKGGNINQC